MHSAYPRILLALDQGRRRLARALVTSGVIRVIGATLAALAGAVLWAALQRVLRIHSVPVAVLVSLGALACFGFAVVRWLVLPLWRLPRRDAFVNLVERRYPGERNLIVNAYQLGESGPGTQGANAPELVDTLVARAADRVGALDLTTWRDPRPDRPYLWAGAAGIAAVALLGLLSPSLLVGASRQVVSPGLAQAPPVTLRVTPGDVQVERGSDVPVTVAVAGTGKRPTLRYRERSGSWRTRELVPTAPDAVSRDGGAWQALLPDVDRDLEYVLRVSGSESPLYAILVREPLRLSGFQIHLRFPAYAGLPPETITAGTGDIAALKGTDVDLRLLANRSLSTAALEWRAEGSETVETIPLAPTAAAPEGEPASPADVAAWRATFRLRDPAHYTVLLTGENGETWRSPSYRVEPAPDRAPLLTLHFPPNDHDLSEDMGERVVADAADDFGFSACRLVYRVDDGEEHVMRYSPFTGGQKEFRLDTLWDLSGLSLAPGSLVSYYLEVLDNDTVSGPKAARSPIRRVRFPTVSEIYEDVAQDHDREIDNLAHLQDTQEDLHEHLEKLEDELKRGRELNYDLRQDVERSLDQQRELERQLQELVGRLQETVSKASNRAQMNNELVQKMSEINELLENLQGQEMKRALDQLAQSLSRMDRNAMRQALEEFQTTQEDMLRGLDRTIELLKQVRREEQVEDVVRRTDEIAELQREIAEEMRKLNEEMGNEKAPDMQGEEAPAKGPEDPELPGDAMQDPAQDREGAPNEEAQKGESSEKTEAEREAAEKAEKDASEKDAENGEENSGDKGEQGKEGKPGAQQKGEEQKGEKGSQESKEGESQEQSGSPEAGEKSEQGKEGDQDQTAEEKALAKDLKELAESLKKARERLAQQKDSAGTSSSSPQQKQSGDQQQQQRMKQLGQDQKRAQELVEELQRTLETLKKLNRQEQEQLSDELEQMEQSESLKQLKKSMQESLAGMQSKAPQRASKYAFEARDQAMNLASMARNMQAQMQTDQDDEIIQMVERLIEGLIELSGGEETLVESAEADDRVLARQQFHLGGTAEALAESLEAIAKKSLQISEDQRKHLSGAAARMDRATRLYEQGNRGKGVHEGRESASDVNEMIVGLMQSHAQMCQSQGQGSSSESMKQKMQGLSQAQQGLNRATREMMERMAGRARLSMTEAQRLGQLAAQQEMIRQGLEQAMNDHQEMKELLGDLDHVQEDMEAVEENLRQTEADPRILDRQEKILSRLLDAQRSMRQQEMSPERESHTGTLVERRPPAPLPEHLLRSERTLEEDVLRGADDRYPSQYRKLVEAYFRALAREDRNH